MYSTKKDSRQAGMTDHGWEGFPTSGNDRSQRAWTSCPFWLSLSLPVKNRQDPSSPCHSGLSRILLLIRSHLIYSTKKDSRQAGMTDYRGQGFPTSGNDRSQRAWTSCPFWLSLSLPIKNCQNPASPFLVIPACPESFFLSDHIWCTQQRRIPDKRE